MDEVWQASAIWRPQVTDTSDCDSHARVRAGLAAG